MNEKMFENIIDQIRNDAGGDVYNVTIKTISGSKIESDTESLELKNGFVICGGSDGTAFVPVQNISEIYI